MTIYKPEVVKKLQQFYRPLLEIDQYAITVKEHITHFAEKMWAEIGQKPAFLLRQINNHHPDYLGTPIIKLKELNFSFEDCQLTITQSFGFKNWAEVEALDQTVYSLEFEKAVHCLIHGKVIQLESLLENFPGLVQQTSKYGHEATLLHYVASNGVEMWRQQVPSNLPELLSLLLEKGADKNSKMSIYGGHFTTLELLKTSAHPYEAELGNVLEKMLLNA